MINIAYIRRQDEASLYGNSEKLLGEIGVNHFRKVTKISP
jgi:hypothetical protein